MNKRKRHDSDLDFDDEVKFFTEGVRISHCPTCKSISPREMLGHNEFTGSPCCESCGFETAADWRDFEQFAKKFENFCYRYEKKQALLALKKWTLNNKQPQTVSSI